MLRSEFPESYLNFTSSSATSHSCDFGQVNHCKPQSPHLINGHNNRIDFVVLSWRLNKVVHRDILAQRLHKLSINKC